MRRAGDRGVGPHVPGRHALPAARRSATATEADDEEELEEAIVAAAEDLWRTGPGDILVFLPGEREIRETADLLRADSRGGRTRRPSRSCRCIARLSPQEQQRVFAPSRGRRIVLATNVAETSLTVPGIRYVIDTRSRARQALLAAQQDDAAADREDLAGGGEPARRPLRPRQDGICVRLYGEDDFAARPAYTDPEILRSSLAAVILRMAALELGDVEAFPFVEPPGPRAIADGYQLLHELGAVDAERAPDAARARARAAAARSARRTHRARGPRRAAAWPRRW